MAVLAIDANDLDLALVYPEGSVEAGNYLRRLLYNKMSWPKPLNILAFSQREVESNESVSELRLKHVITLS